MSQRRSRPRHLTPHRRLPLLVGTAALGALGFGVLGPTISADGATDGNRQAALILAAEQRDVLQSDGGAPANLSGQAASAAAEAQARVQALTAAAATTTPPPAAQPQTFPATPDGYRAYARSKIGATQFACLDPLWSRESHWQPSAHNPASSAYGIPQLLDSTWRYTGVARTSNGFRQVDAGLAYLRAAYPGGPCSAWAHEKSHGWY